MTDYLKKYGYLPDEERILRSLDVISADIDDYKTESILKLCFSAMDLTTLRTNDTPSSVARLVEKVNRFQEEYPSYPMPASICVYSNFAETVKKTKKVDSVNITVVSACFPSSQSFTEVKVRECELAVEAGADEVDIVLALNSFLDGDYETASDEIRQIRSAIDRVAASQGRHVHLKVILETGLLPGLEAIATASFLAMEAGADFIKTSTGKVEVNATPAAAFVMCECIARYYEKTGKKIGFKPAGGISSAADAVVYYRIVSTLLGQEWLNRDLFRLGVSRVANSLMSEIEHRTVSFF